ncbi:alanine racemase [Vibrio splendidus]|uniref:alanine racemase n=1 Tax=Vibrio splendidus TaxID=29497 RepID=UPI00352C5770
MLFRPTAKISLSSLKKNFNTFKSLYSESPIMIMVKANAYGHGMVDVAKCLKLADYFGVARLSEAYELRTHGIENKIVLSEGYFDETEFVLAVDLSLEFVIHQRWQLDILLASSSYSTDNNIWIKVNSGMNRLGFSIDEVFEIYNLLKDSGYNNITLISHLSDADNLESNRTYYQFDKFDKLCTLLGYGVNRSLSNSACLINYPLLSRGIIRLGISIYGINPSNNIDQFPLVPTMTFESKIIAINSCTKNSLVGYSGRWVCPSNTRLAVVAAGYGDGYPRGIKNGTSVFINGSRFPIVGNISMDMMTIDIGDSDINVGDVVELWGENIGVEEIALSANTIPYCLLCSISSRVERVFF